MKDLYRNTPDWIKQIRLKQYDDRFHQLNDLLNARVSGVWSYLLAANGGAAAGTLAFIGARSDLAKLQWSYWILGMFILGVVLVGCAHAFMVHKAQSLVENWNKSVEHYWHNEITWEHLLERDTNVVDAWAKVPWILGWASLLLFFSAFLGRLGDFID